MTKTVRPTGKPLRRTCKNPGCKAKFQTTDTRRVFCCTACQVAGKTVRTRRSTYEIPKTNHFLIYLTNEVRRAGTLHVLDQLVGDVQALEDLYKVVRTRLVANVLNGPKVSATGKASDSFHVAHIAPSQHEFILGHLCAENLIVVPAALNRSHSNLHINKAGVFSYRCELDIRNTILTTDNDILERAIEYIGLDTVIDFCKTVKLSPSQRAAAHKRLSALVDRTDESHAQWLALLNDPKATAPQLVAAIETIEDKKQYKPLMRGEKLNESAMLIQELIRHAEYRPELEDYAAICKGYTKDGYHHTLLSHDSQNTLSKLLHGYLEPEMLDEVEELLYDLRMPVRSAAAKSSYYSQQTAKRAEAEALEAEARKRRAATWEVAALAAEVESGFTAEWCAIPYAAPLAKVTPTVCPYLPESGSLLPCGGIAF